MQRFYTLVFVLQSVYFLGQARITTDTNYYPSGEIKYITYRSNGDVFKDVFYYKNGSKMWEHSFVRGILNGPTYEYDSVGRKLASTEYINRQRSGYSTTYYADSESSDSLIQSQVLYIRGQMSGTYVAYYRNGNVKYKFGYWKGRMAGERMIFNENGTPFNGHFSSCYSNGTVEREGECINGKPEGEFKIYDRKGKLKVLANFKDGKPDGETKYLMDEALSHIQIYENGKFKKEKKIKNHRIAEHAN